MQSLDKTVDSSASNMTPHSPSEYLFAGFCSFSRGVVPLALSETPPSSASKAFFQQRLLWSSIIKPLFDTSSTLQFIILFLGALLILSSIVLWKVFRERHTSTGEKTSSDLQCLRALKDQHETALALIDLVDEDGAGAWPPRADHNSWPLAIRPYKDIYLELVSLLPTAEPSLDDAVNNERIQTYRLLMRTKLAQRIDIAQVVEILANVEAGNQEVLPRAAYNGMYCCVAVCRHAYRWATIPVVKAAQKETTISFPLELDAPWPYLQRYFGVTAESANNTANVLHNFDENGERVYKINVGMSDSITSSEDAFFRMFYDLEVLASPIYNDMVWAIISFQLDDKISCTKYLENINRGVRHLLTIFYENLKESRVSHSVWLSYVQGFQGWGVGRMVGGSFTKYDGLSGNHVLFFQALDAFLDIDRYLTDENMVRYIPFNQRKFCLALKKHSFRNHLSKDDDTGVEAEIQKIVNHVRLFRAAHRTRVMPYLKQPAPERLTMTAGKSILEGPTAEDTKEALEGLDQMLINRLKQTV